MNAQLSDAARRHGEQGAHAAFVVAAHGGLLRGDGGGAGTDDGHRIASRMVATAALLLLPGEQQLTSDTQSFAS